MRVTFYYCNPVNKFKRFFKFILQTSQACGFSHFAIGIDSPYTGENIYEAVFPKVQRTPRSEFDTHYEIFEKIAWDVPPGREAEVLEFCEFFIGRRYALEQILLIAMCVAFFPFNYYLRGVILNGEKALVCTELASRFSEKFFGYVPDESHDIIGLKDSLLLGYKYKDLTKWALQAPK